ncbi:uncharacterized protein V6R79_000226 [Siganus canaliculatus]
MKLLCVRLHSDDVGTEHRASQGEAKRARILVWSRDEERGHQEEPKNNIHRVALNKQTLNSTVSFLS